MATKAQSHSLEARMSSQRLVSDRASPIVVRRQTLELSNQVALFPGEKSVTASGGIKVDCYSALLMFTTKVRFSASVISMSSACLHNLSCRNRRNLAINISKATAHSSWELSLRSVRHRERDSQDAFFLSFPDQNVRGATRSRGENEEMAKLFGFVKSG